MDGHVRARAASAPWLTLVVFLVSLVLWPLEGASAALEFRRGAIEDGAWWQLFTGHLVHFNGDHLFWSIAVFAVLGAMMEREGRRRYAEVLLVSAVLTTLAVFALRPDVAIYRGLSGIDSALFAAVAASRLSARGAGRSRADGSGETALIVLLLAGFVGKTAFETFAGRPVFVGGEAIGFDPVPLAHLVGALVGALVVLGRRRSTPGPRVKIEEPPGLRATRSTA